MERDRKLLKFDTELRLGLPGATDRSVGKRGFDETSGSVGVDLNLNLNFSKEALMDEIEKIKEKKSFVGSKPGFVDPTKPPAAKTQVVGWPPVPTLRKSMFTTTQTRKKDESSESITGATGAAGYVKVSMDGAPYLRKVDLKMYRSYQELFAALVKMFNSFIAWNSGSRSRGLKDFLSEKKTVNLLNGSEFVSTFEDRDGDWMLVGDVPWEMFVDSCKRLRIMKGSEAIGLAPGAAETPINKKLNNPISLQKDTFSSNDHHSK